MKIVALLMCLIFQFCLGQSTERKTIYAQVLNDSLIIDGGYVYNINTKKITFIGIEGYFDILAKENDTLLISSVAFKSVKLVLTKEDLKKSLLIINLESHANQLKEVVVAKTRIPYLGSKQEMIDKPFYDDLQSTAKNSTMPVYGIENGFNFIKVGRIVGDFFSKRKDLKGKRNYYENFQEAALKAVSLQFFTKSLELKEDEIGLFLIFCANDVKSRPFLTVENKFRLIDFLVTKKEEYNRIAIFAK